MPTPEERLTFAVPDKGEVSGVYARPARAFATIVVAHGAGAGMDHPFMSGFTRAMNDEGALHRRPRQQLSHGTRVPPEQVT